MRRSLILFGFSGLLVLACTYASNAAGSSILTVYGAGTLAVPFRALDQVFERKYRRRSAAAVRRQREDG